MRKRECAYASSRTFLLNKIESRDFFFKIKWAAALASLLLFDLENYHVFNNVG